MVSRNFIKSIIYGLALMLLTAGLMYGFSLTQKSASADKTEADYISKLTTAVDNMKNIEIDELNLLQKWKAQQIDAGTAVAQFASFKSQRQALDTNFFSKSAPKKFTLIHFSLSDANTVWAGADDLYREGIFQSRSDFITDADAQVATAKGKFDSALVQLEQLGYKLTS